MKKPADIIRLVFDLVIILFQRELLPVKPAGINAMKQEWQFFEPSWDTAKSLMNDPQFLKKLIEFGNTGKDLMNEETIEFMTPYIDQEYFTPKVAGGASKAAFGLCTFCVAMKDYFFASKVGTCMTALAALRD